MEVSKIFAYTVTKAKRDARQQHMGDGKCRHQSTVEQSEKSAINILYSRSGRWIYVDGGIFRHPHDVGLRHAWLF
jgi:hypothetical protein